MVKIILSLLFGLGIGAAAGFYFGTQETLKTQIEILNTEKGKAAQQISECNQQKTTLEEQNKTISAELKLNESRPGFVTSATLDSPQFSPPNLEPISSDKNGDILLQWTSIQGAKKYIINVEDQEGKLITSVDVEGETSLYLNRMAQSNKIGDGNYLVRIATINGLDQAGPYGPSKPIQFAKKIKVPTKKPKTKKK
jgi:hypothetical protein